MPHYRYFFILFKKLFQNKKDTNLPSKPQIKPAPLLQKTRKLPSWLIQSTSSETKSPVKKEGNRKGKAPASTTGKPTANAREYCSVCIELHTVK